MPKLQEIRVRGGKHRLFDWQAALDTGALKLGCQLYLVRQPDNEFDSNAIQAWVEDSATHKRYHIGYVEARRAAWFAPRMDAGAVVHLCTVTKVDDKHKGVDATLDLRGGWSALEQRDPPNQTPNVTDDDIPF